MITNSSALEQLLKLHDFEPIMVTIMSAEVCHCVQRINGDGGLQGDTYFDTAVIGLAIGPVIDSDCARSVLAI